MPSLLESPFAQPSNPRKPGVAGLVGDFFGEGAKKALEKEIGKDKRAAEFLQEDWRGADIELSEAERAGMKKEAENRAWTREQYIEWAEEIGKNEDWVDDTFIFHPNGTTEIAGWLNLSYAKEVSAAPLTRLPRGWRRIGGHLSLIGNPLASLEGLPQEIGSDLALNGIPATTIPAGLSIGGKIYIDASQTELVEDAKRKGYRVNLG